MGPRKASSKTSGELDKSGIKTFSRRRLGKKFEDSPKSPLLPTRSSPTKLNASTVENSPEKLSSSHLSRASPRKAQAKNSNKVKESFENVAAAQMTRTTPKKAQAKTPSTVKESSETVAVTKLTRTSPRKVQPKKPSIVKEPSKNVAAPQMTKTPKKAQAKTPCIVKESSKNVAAAQVTRTPKRVQARKPAEITNTSLSLKRRGRKHNKPISLLQNCQPEISVSSAANLAPISISERRLIEILNEGITKVTQKLNVELHRRRENLRNRNPANERSHDYDKFHQALEIKNEPSLNFLQGTKLLSSTHSTNKAEQFENLHVEPAFEKNLNATHSTNKAEQFETLHLETAFEENLNAFSETDIQIEEVESLASVSPNSVSENQLAVPRPTNVVENGLVQLAQSSPSKSDDIYTSPYNYTNGGFGDFPEPYLNTAFQGLPFQSYDSNRSMHVNRVGYCNFGNDFTSPVQQRSLDRMEYSQSGKCPYFYNDGPYLTFPPVGQKTPTHELSSNGEGVPLWVKNRSKYLLRGRKRKQPCISSKCKKIRYFNCDTGPTCQLFNCSNCTLRFQDIHSLRLHFASCLTKSSQLG